jgi:hypothetical protein
VLIRAGQFRACRILACVALVSASSHFACNAETLRQLTAEELDGITAAGPGNAADVDASAWAKGSAGRSDVRTGSVVDPRAVMGSATASARGIPDAWSKASTRLTLIKSGLSQAASGFADAFSTEGTSTSADTVADISSKDGGTRGSSISRASGGDGSASSSVGLESMNGSASSAFADSIGALYRSAATEAFGYVSEGRTATGDPVASADASSRGSDHTTSEAAVANRTDYGPSIVVFSRGEVVATGDMVTWTKSSVLLTRVHRP